MGVTLNKKSTTTEPPPKNGQQAKPPWGLNAFYWYQIFALDSAVVEVQEMFSSHGSLLTNASSWRNTLFKLTHYDTPASIVYSKTCLKRPLSKGPKLVFKTNYRLIQVKSIAECSNGSILQYF